MPKDTSVKAALELIASNLIKERQEGLDLLTEICSNPANCERLQNTPGGLGWLQVFQSLFKLVRLEQRTALDNAKAASILRFQAAAGKVRWLVEVSNAYLTNKPLAALYSHLIQTMVSNGALVKHVALHYAKALRVLLSYPPHLENMEQDTWRYLMHIIWDAVLDKRLEQDKDDWDAEAQGTIEPAVSQADSDEDEGSSRARTGATAVKRKRSTKSTLDSVSEGTSKPRYKTLSAESVELLSLFPLLLSSSSAPILPPSRLPEPDTTQVPHRTGIPLLNRVLDFLKHYPEETGSHRPVIQGLNILLRELELNAIDEVTKLGAKLFPLLVKLWGTRDLTLRDQVLISLRTILPYLAREKQKARVAAPLTQVSGASLANPGQFSGVLGERMTAEIAAAMQELQDSIIKDVGTKRGILPLDLTTLCIRLPSRANSDEAESPDEALLVDPNFPWLSCVVKAGPNFTARSAATWATLQLDADCHFKLHQNLGSADFDLRAPGTAPPTKRSKRESPVDPVLALLSFIQTSNHSDARLLKIQTLYFLIDRHWNDMFLDIQARIRDQMLSLLLESDLEIQQWAFVCMTAILVMREAKTSRRPGHVTMPSVKANTTILDRSPEERKTWQEIWTIALRRINLAAGVACRGACLVVEALMRSGFVSDPDIASAVTGFFEEIMTQGPSTTYDSVCSLTSAALDFAERDSKLYRLDQHQKVIIWFRHSWRAAQAVANGSATSSTNLPIEAVKLLVKACGIATTPVIWTETPSIVTDLAKHMYEQTECSPIRNYLLHAVLPVEEASEFLAINNTSQPKELAPVPAMPSATMHEKTTQVLGLLHETLKEITANMDLNTAAKLKSAADVAVFCIHTWAAICESDDEPEHGTVGAACDVLDKVLQQVLQDGNHSSQDTASLLSSFIPLLGQPLVKSRIERRYHMWPMLSIPDAKAGVTTLSTVDDSETQPSPLEQTAAQALLISIWKSDRLHDMMTTHLPHFRRYLAANQAMKSNQSLAGSAARQEDDDFGPIRQEEDGGLVTDGNNEQHHVALSVSIAVRAIINPAYYHSGMQAPTRDTELYNILIESEDLGTYVLSEAIFEAIEDQRLVLTRKGVGSLVELGMDLTRIYAYKKLTSTRDFIYNLLSATLWTWIHQEESVVSAAEELLPFWRWCVDNLVQGKVDCWRNRHRILMLLDAYIAADPSETRWYADGLAERDQETPSGALLQVLEDSDSRIRFRVATSLPRLLQLDMPISSKPSGFYLRVARQFQYQGTDKEYILSRAMLMTNVVITSSGARRAPFFHLYDAVAGRPRLQTHIEAAFQAVTLLLRLSSFSVLYLEYATRLLAAQGKEDQDPLHIPVSLYGFHSRVTWASNTITVAGASLLLSPECEGFWESLVEVAQIDKVETLRQHAATAIAMAAAMRCMTDTDGKTFRSELNRIKARYASVNNGKSADWVFTPAQTANMVATLFQLVDESISPVSIHELLQRSTSSEGDRNASTYKALLFPQDHQQPTELDETITPKNTAAEVLRAIQLLNREFQLDPNLIVVNTLMQLMSKISGSCLVNERRRMVYSFALLISSYPDTALVPEIFDLILRAIACLYNQEDLAGLMINFLTWALEQLLQGKAFCKTPVPVLSGLANSAKAYSSMSSIHSASGRAALSALENFMLRVFSERSPPHEGLNQRLTRDIARLLALWPRTLPTELEDKVSAQTYGQIRDQAARTDLVTGKFTLAKHLARHSQSELFSATYKKSTFWQLRASIAQAPTLPTEDMQAFMLLLYNGEGSVEIPDHETIDGLTGSTGVPPVSFQITSQSTDQTAATRRHIISILLEDLRGTDLCQVPLAYRALAGIGLHSPSLVEGAGLDSISKAQLGLLASIEALPVSQPHTMKDLEEAVVGQGHWKLLHETPLEWTAGLARLLIQALSCHAKYSAFLYLTEIVSVSNRLASQLISPLLHLLLVAERDATSDDNTNHRSVCGYLDWLLSHDDLSNTCSSIIVQSVLYLRNFPLHCAVKSANGLGWLQLDLRALARAALRCRLPETALLFWELLRDGISDNSDLSEADLSLLYEIYDNVEEPDGFYGVPLAGDARSAVLQRLHHEEDWTQAFSYHGASYEVSSDRSENLPLVARSLRSFGFDALASTLLREVSGGLGHIPYDLAWRTRQWDVPIASTIRSGIGVEVFRTLRSVHHARNASQAWDVAKKSLHASFADFGTIGMENMAGIRAGIRSLLCLREVDLWFSDLQPLVQLDDFEDRKWAAFRTLPENMDTSMADEILNVRLSLLQAAKSAEGPQLGDLVSAKAAGLISIERDCLTAIGSLARARGDLSGAITALTRVQHLTQADANDHSTEFAEVLWLQGQHGLALEQLKRLLRTRIYLKPANPQQFWLRANVLSLLGQWTAEARQATEIEIHENYFKTSNSAVYHAQKAMTPQQVAGVTLRYAQFADQQFQAMSDSEQIKRLKLHHNRMLKNHEDSLAYYHRKGKDDLNLRDNIRTIKQECLRNADQLQRHEKHRLEFLVAALTMYAKVISSTDTYNNLVLRFCAIWLSTEADADTNLHIAKPLRDIPSHKFVDLAHQLTARLQPNTAEASQFQQNLYALVTRVCAEHPFHMAYQVITLAAPLTTKTNRRTSTNLGPREHAAYTLLAQVKIAATKSVEIEQMERFSRAAISWAREDNGKKGEDGRYTAAKNSAILTLKDMNIPIATAELPVDPTMAYKRIPRLMGYDAKFTIAGGIHHPKIMVCRNSEGRQHRELFKAGDDTRQDTIMQQLFRLANNLLQKDVETRRRKLHMRTYNVVTLAEETGLIQYVGQTVSLADYLLGAHAKYNPGDISVKEFRDSMRKVQNAEDPERNQKLVAIFRDNRKRFRPVMRHFFTGRKKEPLGWFAMRLAYSRSLAVSNIVGYIVGIGDRHCSNILIDHLTGELVHIDFGVAFGQGRSLPIPELVPFRLTADLVDALGSFGTQGVYQRCSENTLRVMRNTSEHLLAILEVFKHDPLHRWKISAETMKKVQDGLPAQKRHTKSISDPLGTADLNDHAVGHADQALAEIINKLDKRMSVEYTVNDWNRSAQDPGNLAIIFVGWQPWL